MTLLNPARRPTTLEEIQKIGQRMGNEEGKTAWKSFQPQPTDVFITPYGKSGTTWLQQIVHGLRTRGDMDFDDISRAGISWLETAYDLGIDLNAPAARPTAGLQEPSEQQYGTG